MTKYQKILLGIFIIAVIWSAISPASMGDWWLEISPVLVFIPIIIFLGRKFKISSFSYTIIVLYMLLPIIQAHYGVAHVPFGFTLSKWEGIVDRNMFDRLTHFAFGLLWFYPLYGIMREAIGKHRREFLSYFLPFSIIMMFGAMYEVLELIVRQTASSKLSFLFVAAQGDFWDTSKDLANTAIGAVLAIIIILIMNKIRENKYLKKSPIDTKV
jgi:putative membrane protein